MLSTKGNLSEKEQKNQKFIDNGEKLMIEKQLTVFKRANSNSLNLDNSNFDKRIIMPKMEEKVNQTAVTHYIVKENIPNIKSVTIIKKGPISKIIDFTVYKKIDALTDNEFIYCKRVGNPIEFEECSYNQLKGNIDMKTKKKQLLAKKEELEYITISKNVKN